MHKNFHDTASVKIPQNAGGLSCCKGKIITSWLRRLGSATSCLYFKALVRRSTHCSSHSLHRPSRDGKQWPAVPLRPQAQVHDEDADRRKVASAWLRGVMGSGPEKLSKVRHCLLLCFSNLSKVFSTQGSPLRTQSGDSPTSLFRSLLCFSNVSKVFSTQGSPLWTQSGDSPTSLFCSLHSDESSHVKSACW